MNNLISTTKEKLRKYKQGKTPEPTPAGYNFVVMCITEIERRGLEVKGLVFTNSYQFLDYLTWFYFPSKRTVPHIRCQLENRRALHAWISACDHR